MLIDLCLCAWRKGMWVSGAPLDQWVCIMIQVSDPVGGCSQLCYMWDTWFCQRDAFVMRPSQRILSQRIPRFIEDASQMTLYSLYSALLWVKTSANWDAHKHVLLSEMLHKAAKLIRKSILHETDTHIHQYILTFLTGPKMVRVLWKEDAVTTLLFIQHINQYRQ
jgi:hypothetical protein